MTNSVSNILSPTATALLKAAVLPPETALIHWQTWTKTQGLARFDPTDANLLPRLFDPLTADEQRIMPLIYRNLEKTDDRLMPHLRGIYRYTWMNNQRLLHKVTQAVGQLQMAGIPTLLMKGLALSLHYYGDLGVRYMTDADLLVPTDRADEAIAVLRAAPASLNPTAIDYRLRRCRHDLPLHAADGVNIDLHRHLLYTKLYAGADAGFWADSQPVALPGGLITRRLSDTDQLFHLLVHGYRWEQAPLLRWIHDCYVVYNQPDARIDWHHLLDRSEEGRFNWPVQQNLNQLRRDWNLTLPPDVATRLDALPIGPTERAYFALIDQRPAHLPGKLWRFWQKNQWYYALFQQGRPGPAWPAFMLARVAMTANDLRGRLTRSPA